MIFEELNKLEIQKPAHKQRQNAWLISFFDLIGVLVAFFIMIYSTKDVAPERISEIKNSFVNYVNGKEQGKQYVFNEKAGKAVSVKKAENITFLLSVLRNSPELNSPDMGKLNIIAQPYNVNIQMQESYGSKEELKTSLEKKLYTLSKYLNPLSNQIEVKLYLSDNSAGYELTEFVAGKIEDLGYENKVIRILPEELAEKIEDQKPITGTDKKPVAKKNTPKKEDSFIKIEIIINSYEAVI